MKKFLLIIMSLIWLEANAEPKQLGSFAEEFKILGKSVPESVSGLTYYHVCHNEFVYIMTFQGHGGVAFAPLFQYASTRPIRCVDYPGEKK